MTFLTASLALPTASWASPLPFCKAQLGVAYGLSGALLDRAGGLVSHSLDLVGSAAHNCSPGELMAARSPALHLINATICVRVAQQLISVEKFLMKIHHECY